MERSALLVTISVYFGVCLNQSCSWLKITDVGGMMQSRPSVWIHGVNIGVAVLDDWLKCERFVLSFVRKNSFVNWCLAKYALTIVNLATTVYKVLYISFVWLASCFVQVLQNVSCEFVLADIKRSFNKSSWLGFGAFLDQKSWSLKIPEEASDVKGRLKVKVLLVQNFSQQVVCLDFKLIANATKVSGLH